MARILYGVMGNTYGHIMRTLSIVSCMPQHDYYFVGGGRVPEALQGRYPVLEMPVLRTVHRKQKVSVSATIGQIARRVVEIPSQLKRLQKLIDEFQPDLAICDREFFTPLAAQRADLPCISIDHSHVMKACEYPVPSDQRLSWFLAMLNDYLLFDFTRQNLIVSFFHPPRKVHSTDELFPPVLRPEVKAVTPSVGDYIFVYQTSATFAPLIEALRHQPRPVVIYGFKKEAEVSGNLTFKPYDQTALLEDLAGSAYAIVNGGHNVICEALYYSKPVLCFPIAMLFEQFINAWHIRSLGYGDFSTTMEPSPSLFSNFETNLETYRANLAGKNFDGTEQIVNRLQELIASHTRR
jgi:uncharacterized protein (TIGR00661 family)